MEVSGNITPQLLYPLKITLVLPDNEVVWGPKLIWTFWKSEKFLAPARTQGLEHPTHNLISIPTTISQLIFSISFTI
jgi:hypothetical protein